MKKTVLITGASRGIGRSAARLFASAGYHVFLNCSTSIEPLKELAQEILSIPGGSCTLVPGNVGNAQVVRDIFQQIYQECDHLDVLVNNAGISHIGLLHDMSDEEWDKILNTNLSSVFYCCREAIPSMISQKRGRIINVSSMWGTSGASCEAAYSASKSGVNGLTRALAKELAPSNIQVNAIAFGVIDTEMNSQLDPEERAALAYEIPAGRFATSEEAAQMILNIAEAPEYMTGQVIGFDGGYL
jgi:3-oxoacyl-[acyl-carrier protein] reductase